MKFRAIFLALLLVSCRNNAPPVPTSEEANQLDDAEAMLNDIAANEGGPADRSAGPANRSR